MMVDLFVLNLPKVDLRAPSLALAQLKACAEHDGFTTRAFDLNIWLWRKLVVMGLGHWWSYNDSMWFDRNTIDANMNDVHSLLHQAIREEIVPYNPKVIGISLFSVLTFQPLPIMLGLLREYFPSTKIVLGGPGISIRNKEFCEQEFSKIGNLFDDYIYGNCESAIGQYLSGTLTTTNSFTVSNFDSEFRHIPPDYSDFDFTQYPKKHTSVTENNPGPNKWVYMAGSRGCVRSCTFCDVASIWPTFKTKTGTDIANEMIHLYDTYGVDKFRFTDSLLNGNPKVFREQCETLVKRGYGKKLIWHGQFICRHHKQMPPELFDQMKDAGVDLVSIGIESGSERVRADMLKPFDDVSLFNMLDNFERTGIKFVPLMIVGYPTETEDDFVKTLDFIDRLPQYKTLVDINLNNPMRVLPGSPVGDDPEHYGISYTALVTNDDFTKSWACGDNDYATRIERYFRFHKRLIENGLSQSYAGGDGGAFRKDYYLIKGDNISSEMKEIIEFVYEGRTK